MTRRHLWRIANGIMGVAFVLAAVVQFNDPDPLRWIAVYGAAAVVCALVGWPQVAGGLAILVLVVAVGWAVLIFIGLDHLVGVGEMVRPMERGGGPIEQSRELGGLGLVAAWMIVVAVVSRRRAVSKSAS